MLRHAPVRHLIYGSAARHFPPTHADVYDIDVIFVSENDLVTPLGIKGVGEIGTVGTAAAIGNAIYHATGVRSANYRLRSRR